MENRQNTDLASVTIDRSAGSLHRLFASVANVPTAASRHRKDFGDLAPEERGVAPDWDMPIDRPMPPTRYRGRRGKQS